ncbi:LPXTG cell wall anchor domain-containing protein [Limosilactobacillus fermentum]
MPQTGNDEGLLVSALGMVLATAFGIQKRKED